VAGPQKPIKGEQAKTTEEQLIAFRQHLRTCCSGMER
jgi:hypothetical protein